MLHECNLTIKKAAWSQTYVDIFPLSEAVRLMAHLEPVIMFLQVQGESKPLLKGQRAEYRGVFGTIFTMVKTEGPRSLYSGLVAGLHRQMSFASIRIGMYDTMKQLYTRGSESTSASKPHPTTQYTAVYSQCTQPQEFHNYQTNLTC